MFKLRYFICSGQEKSFWSCTNGKLTLSVCHMTLNTYPCIIYCYHMTYVYVCECKKTTTKKTNCLCKSLLELVNYMHFFPPLAVGMQTPRHPWLPFEQPFRPKKILQRVMHTDITKSTKWSVRSSKTQISLDIRPVWWASSLTAWRRLGALPLPIKRTTKSLIRLGAQVGVVMHRRTAIKTQSSFG